MKDETNDPSATPARRYHRGNVAEDLKTVALRILETERLEDLSVRRLAREVGVTPANFYNHFDSLGELLLDIASDVLDERRALNAHIQRTSKTRAEAVKRSTQALVELACDKPQLFRVTFGHIPHDTVTERFRSASDASFAKTAELVYGHPIDDAADWDASREKYKAAYGAFAIAYGLARIMSERQVPFSRDRRVEMLAFVDGVVDTFLSGEITRLLA